jgi:hypothetical protein
MDENPDDISKLAVHAAALGSMGLHALRIPNDQHIQLSQDLLAQIPDSARKDFQDPDNAKAHLLSIVISTNDQPQNLIRGIDKTHPEKMPMIERNLALIRSNKAQRLVIFQLSLGPLRSVSAEERRQTWTLLFNAFQSDQTLTLLEALFLFLAKQALLPPVKTTTQIYQKPNAFHAAGIARLCFWFDSKLGQVELKNEIELITTVKIPNIPDQKLTWLLFEDQLNRLLRLDLNHRQKIVALFLKTMPIEHHPDQGELFRLLSLCLGVPIPPLLAEKEIFLK